MINNHNDYSKQEVYFKYLGSPITPALYASNRFHQILYQMSSEKGYLLTFGKSLKVFRERNLHNLSTEFGMMDSVLASASAAELRRGGLPLPIGFEKQNKLALIHSYLFNSSLCYVEVEQKDGRVVAFYATKSRGVLTALGDELAESERKKKVKSFAKHLSNSYEELFTGVFEVVKITPDMGGMKLSKAKVNINRKEVTVFPMYVMGNYVDRLIERVERQLVTIAYNENGVTKHFKTSLRPDILAKWLKTNDLKKIKHVQDHWQNPFFLGEVILPNLSKRGEFITVRITQIVSIKKASKA